MKFKSIRHKLVLSLTFFIALLLIAIAVANYIYFRNAIQEQILAQQFSSITSLAEKLDQDIKIAHKALLNVANRAPPESVSDPEVTRKWLEERAGLRAFFGHALIVLDKNGTMIASVPSLPGSYGLSFQHRDYFTKTMGSGQPVISEPFVTVANDHPVIMMTAIIRAEDGSVKGLLCGSIDLFSPEGFFGQLKDTRIGSSGYLYLFAKDRTMIMHPDRSRIMKQDVKPGASLLFDRAVDGFEGSDQIVNSRGFAFLSSFKRLQTTGWILAANFPLEEAFAPVTRFRDFYLFSMLVILIVSAALAWWFGSGITRPIERFVSQLNRLAQPGADRELRLDSQRTDELGVLAASFNALLDEVRRKEKELMDAQGLLLQAEKLASVGQLAAGVAHEINNPIGFINSNLGSLKTQINDLLNVLAAYKAAEPALAGNAELLASIGKAKSDADLEFLENDILALINESLDGAHRVKTIVDDLKNFSRVDDSEWQVANLESGLESTLNLVWNELRHKVEVVKDYAGLPEIECIPSQLNQVFLNLLLNAADAIEEQGTITLRSGFDENELWIDIADTGTGIKPEHASKIFDPFFTTKPIGKGTGLGLSQAYGIVKRHHGQLGVQSEPGKGTVFRITLPRKRAQPKP